MATPTRALGIIDPACLYNRRAFLVVSGISETRLREARKKYDLEPRKLWTGKRAWIRGRDAITFIEQLAAAEINHGSRA